MKKKILAGLLLTSFITMNSAPALAFIHLGVQKDSTDNKTKVEQTKTEKPKKEKHKNYLKDYE